MKDVIMLNSRGRWDEEKRPRLIKVAGTEATYKLKADNYKIGKLPDGREYLDPEGGPFMYPGARIRGVKEKIADVHKTYVRFEIKEKKKKEIKQKENGDRRESDSI